jgi:hypothetical protein
MYFKLKNYSVFSAQCRFGGLYQNRTDYRENIFFRIIHICIRISYFNNTKLNKCKINFEIILSNAYLK